MFASHFPPDNEIPRCITGAATTLAALSFSLDWKDSFPLTIHLVFSAVPTPMVSNDLHQYVPRDTDGSREIVLTVMLRNSDTLLPQGRSSFYAVSVPVFVMNN